jgi:photosystem II stability/assembly factor-like uncharacterized protein
MKKLLKNILSGLLFALCASVLTYTGLLAQWEQTSGPISISVSDLFAKTDTTFAATGGGVYRSTNGGHSWQMIAFQGMAVRHVWASKSLVFATVVDSSVGPSLGFDLYRSGDAGATWTPITGLGRSSVALWSIAGSDSNIWVSVSLVTPNGFTVMHSTDGGTDWLPSLIPGGSASAGPVWLCTAGDTVFAGTEQGIFENLHGTGVWTKVPGITHPVAVHAVCYDGSALYAGTNEGIYSSLDRGASWSLYSGVLQTQRFASVQTASGSIVLAGDSLNYYSSTDRGAHWNFLINLPTGLAQIAWAGTMQSTGTSQFLLSTGSIVYGLNPKDFSLVEQDTGILNADAYSLQFINGKLYATTQNGIDRTSDEGKTWEHFTTSSTPAPTSVIVNLGTTIFVGGQGLFRSTDDGVTWIPLGSIATNFQSITALAIADGRLFVGANGLGGALYSSNDLGATWKVADTLLQGIVYSIYAYDSLIVVFTSAGRYRSLDTGNTWTSSDPLNYFGNFVPELAGDGGLLLTSAAGLERSSDGGDTWSPVSAPISDPSILASVFISGQLACAGTSEGVFYSFTAGQTWKSIAGNLAVTVPSVVLDNTYIFAGTYGSSVWRMPISSVHVEDQPKQLAAFENYPNPFSSATTVRFHLATSGHASLRLFDALGRSISTLLDADLSSGDHAVRIDGSHLAPGVYLASLATSGGVQLLPVEVVR